MSWRCRSLSAKAHDAKFVFRDELAGAVFAGQPNRAALRLERGDDPVEKLAEELPAVAARAREFGDLGDVLADLRAGLFEELFLFERGHDGKKLRRAADPASGTWTVTAPPDVQTAGRESGSAGLRRWAGP